MAREKRHEKREQARYRLGLLWALPLPLSPIKREIFHPLLLTIKRLKVLVLISLSNIENEKLAISVPGLRIQH